MNKQDTLNLKKRYLIWLYKTTKEAFDRTERKFTQLEIDRLILKELLKKGKDKKLEKFTANLKTYIENKEKVGMNLKYANSDFNFLVLKLEAVEKAITRTLGSRALLEIKALYEKEMTERILKSTEHR